MGLVQATSLPPGACRAGSVRGTWTLPLTCCASLDQFLGLSEPVSSSVKCSAHLKDCCPALLRGTAVMISGVGTCSLGGCRPRGKWSGLTHCGCSVIWLPPNSPVKFRFLRPGSRIDDHLVPLSHCSQELEGIQKTSITLMEVNLKEMKYSVSFRLAEC